MSVDNTHLKLEQLRLWAADKLPLSEQKKVEEHLEVCDACARQLDRFPDPSLSVLSLFENAMVVQGGEQRIEQGPQQGAEGQESTDNTTTVIGALGETSQDPGSQNPSSFHLSAISTRWKFQRLLASGGIGEIWVAQDQMFNRAMAVKCLRREHGVKPSVQRRFLREAHITAELIHPGVPCVIEVHESGPDSFYVMPLVTGRTFDQAIDEYHARRAVNEDDAFSDFISLLKSFDAIANTIAYANLRGIVHRDVKGENVIIGELGQVTVIDWGIAKRIGAPDQWGDDADDDPIADQPVAGKPGMTVCTRVGSRIGTPAYMAPEQVRGDVDSIDQRTDVYGLAALLYRIVTGKVPFECVGIDAMFESILTDLPTPFRDHGIRSLEPLEEICRKGLSKLPAERQQSAVEIGEAVSGWIHQTMQEIQSNAERAHLFSLTDDLLAIVDRGESRGIRWANPSFERELGWTPEELVGMDHYDLLHPDDAQWVGELFDDMVGENAKLADFEPRMRCRDGSYKWFSWTAARIPGEKTAYYIGRNVDDRHREEEKNRQLLDGVPASLLVINEAREVTYANRHAALTLGYAHSSLIGSPVEKFVSDAPGGTLNESIASCLSASSHTSLQENVPLMWRNHDGEQLETRTNLHGIEVEFQKLIMVTFNVVTPGTR